jgi:hypothetical protein
MSDKIYWAIIDAESKKVVEITSGDVGGLAPCEFDAETWIEIDESQAHEYGNHDRWSYEDGSWIDSTTFRDERILAYPSIAEQLDYIYHNGIEAWKTDIILPVKTAIVSPLDHSPPIIPVADE